MKNGHSLLQKLRDTSTSKNVESISVKSGANVLHVLQRAENREEIFGICTPSMNISGCHLHQGTGCQINVCNLV